MSTLSNDHVTSVPQGWVGGRLDALYWASQKCSSNQTCLNINWEHYNPWTFVSDPIVSRKNKGNYYGQQSMVHIIREGVQMISASTLQSLKENQANSSLCFGFEVDLLSRTDSWTDEPHQFWVSVGNNRKVFIPSTSLEFGYHELVPWRLTYLLKTWDHKAQQSVLHQSTAILWRRTLRSPSHRYLLKLKCIVFLEIIQFYVFLQKRPSSLKKRGWQC